MYVSAYSHSSSYRNLKETESFFVRTQIFSLYCTFCWFKIICFQQFSNGETFLNVLCAEYLTLKRRGDWILTNWVSNSWQTLMCWVFGGPTIFHYYKMILNIQLTFCTLPCALWTLTPVKHGFHYTCIHFAGRQTSYGYGETRQFAAFFTVLALCMIIHKLCLLFCRFDNDVRKSFDNITKGNFSKWVLTFMRHYLETTI